MTNRSALEITFALLLIVAAAVLWSRARAMDHVADAQVALVSLRYREAYDSPATAAAARYWSGEYATVRSSDDPLLAANAAYRAAVAPGGAAHALVGRLDAVVKQYADILRDDPENEDAAYNYEFVVRYRAAVAARGVPVPPAGDVATVSPHGRVGGPVRGTSDQQFKVLVPMRPDERQEAEDAGKSGRRVRKG